MSELDPSIAPARSAETPEDLQATGLRRSLTLRHIVFLGLAYMAPLAVFDTFGIVADITNGHVPLSYLLVLVAVLITALSYAKMVRFYPRAGSAYTYTREAINPHLGFLVGWAATLDYLLLPMINALLSAIYMTAAFPDVPSWVWILSTIVVCTALNLTGVRIAAKVNVILVVIQVVVAVAFVALTIKNIAEGANGSPFSVAPFFAPGIDAGAIASGAAILALSFLGFDAVSTLAEEAEHPRRDIPRAILIIVGVAGLFFVSVTYVMQVLFPDVSAVGNIVGASPEIAKYIGGAAFQALFIGGYMVAVLGCGITQQLSAARLLYAMGRDGALPQRFFGRLNRAGVPAGNVLLIAALACSALFLDLSRAASLINFGAFVAFIFVNLSVIFTYVRFVKARGWRKTIGFVVLPALGVAINVALWFSLEPSAMIVGAVWVAIGVGYLLWRTRFFREAPPALSGPSEEL
ncbi:APC family permease [Leifsonia sp. 22587]|uniref:APC family permease n=1 Tax=Leifsonia sp. 22587 TaxID=3453946 RepID=UPI003F864D8A